MDEAVTALNLGFGGEPLAAFAAWLVEKSWCSRQSLLPDGFARHITKVSCCIHFNPLFVYSGGNRRTPARKLREKRDSSLAARRWGGGPRYAGRPFIPQKRPGRINRAGSEGEEKVGLLRAEGPTMEWALS